METEQITNFVNELLKQLINRGGSDLFLTTNYPPTIKVDGVLVKISQQSLTSAHTRALAHALMNDRQTSIFERTKESNFAISPAGLGRFRVNVYWQKEQVGIVIRKINIEIPTTKQLGLPDVLNTVVEEKLGLILMVGSTGSGKSTSLAAMINHRNEKMTGHIITIEDPIEFMHPHKNCIISQREIGYDTDSWENAVHNALRQAPDVVLLGEIRDREGMDIALQFADTGHLCLASLHANHAIAALTRVLSFYPVEKRDHLLSLLSLSLRAIISQRLIPRERSKGRVPAVEVLINTPTIAEFILKNEFTSIKEAMKNSRNYGMQTFDQALFDLYEAGLVTYEDAILRADSANDLRIDIKLRSKRGGVKDLDAGTEGYTVI